MLRPVQRVRGKAKPDPLIKQLTTNETQGYEGEAIPPLFLAAGSFTTGYHSYQHRQRPDLFDQNG